MAIEKAKAEQQRPFRIWPQIAAATSAIVLMVVVGGGWAATAKLSGAVIAPGSVVVERNVKKVQHLDGGIVAEIAVREGDRVKAGDVVLRLDVSLTKAELGVIESQLVELAGRRVRFTAERDGLAQIKYPADFDAMNHQAASIRDGETRLFNENRKTRESQKQQLRIRIGQLEQEIKGLQSQADAKQSEINIIQKELVQVRELFNKNLTPITRVYSMERDAARLVGDRGNFMAQIARAMGQVSEVQLQIISVDQNTRTEAQRELRNAEGRIAELTERQAAAKDRLGRTEIRAPQAGMIHELAVHTVGGVITPASTIMMIVPDDEKLNIEVRVAPTDIDQVRVGQEARLKFVAFNQNTTPEVAARVTYVAANSSQDPKTGASYYTARTEMDRTASTKLAGLELVPGMPVEAYIATGERTAISYLLKPVADQLGRAFREQ